MDAALFSAHDVNTPRAAVEGYRELPDGSELIWGLSRREFGPMSFRNRPAWDVTHNRMQFLRYWDLLIDDVASPTLEHTAHVEIATSEDRGRGARNLDNAFASTDALLTRDPNLVLLTTHADCLPVWVTAPEAGWIGMAHVGWRGLQAGILRTLLDTLPADARKHTEVAVGPGISASRYEVGPEVADLFLADPVLAPAVIQKEGHSFLDLADGAKRQAEAAGAAVEMGMTACTFDNPYLSSYRRDGESFSPMAAFIVRRSR